MSRYQFLAERRSHKQPSYLPYVLLGYPDAKTSLEVCKTLIEEGVHGLELGLPFRDPVADGPVIQQAASEALDNGFKIDQAIEIVHEIRAMNNDIPLTMMSYYNMVFARGPARFFEEFAKAGLDGILIPDMPPERADELIPLAQEHGLKLVFIAAPNSSEDRLKLIATKAEGFVYVVTRLGITGAEENYTEKLPEFLARIQKNIPLPAIAGFGISEPAHARQMIDAGADGFIVGSKVVQITKDSASGGVFNSEPLRQHTKSMLDA